VRSERDMKLAIEVADIIDELKILKSLLEKQRNLTDSMEKISSSDISREQSEHLHSVLSNVEEIKTEAEATYRSVRTKCMASDIYRLTKSKVLELLDLKSKLASLSEAHETTKQGQAVMLFTVVTIIFVGPSLRASIVSAKLHAATTLFLHVILWSERSRAQG
jgi:hypothetical protein